MAKRYKDWLKQAQQDIEHARKSLDMKDYNWSCFAAQQGAEKAMKALYDYLGGEGWGHVIVKLLKELPPDKISVPEDILEKAVYLDKHYILTRYPNGFESGAPSEFYTPKEAKEAIKYAGDIFSFVKAHLSE